MAYDHNNIFAKILRNEIPSKKIYEDEYAFAFHDIAPQAPIHVLVIPKGPYVSLADFSTHASAEEIAGFYKAANQVAILAGLDKNGYRAIANTGFDAHQEVQHFHLHLLGGCDLGSMLKKGLMP